MGEGFLAGIIERQVDRFAFWHASFREYLVAPSRSTRTSSAVSSRRAG